MIMPLDISKDTEEKFYIIRSHYKERKGLIRREFLPRHGYQFFPIMYKEDILMGSDDMYSFRVETLYCDDVIYLRVDVLFTNGECYSYYYYLKNHGGIVSIQYDLYINQFKITHDGFSMGMDWKWEHEIMCLNSEIYKIYTRTPEPGSYPYEILYRGITLWSINEHINEMFVRAFIYETKYTCILTIVLRNEMGMLTERHFRKHRKLRNLIFINRLPTEIVKVRDSIGIKDGGYGSTERYLVQTFIRGISIDIMYSHFHELIRPYMVNQRDVSLNFVLEAPYGLVIKKILDKGDLIYNFQHRHISGIYLTIIGNKTLVHFRNLNNGSVGHLHYHILDSWLKITYVTYNLFIASSLRHIEKYDIQKITEGILSSQYVTEGGEAFIICRATYGYFVDAVYIGDECMWTYWGNQNAIFDYVKMKETKNGIRAEVYLLNKDDTYILQAAPIMPRGEIEVLA
ncbi:hypothetical protein BdWA1_003468 [Babesia duncani]|uniref:Uncharacterized protein n=1 Tax=Babesia duncani TaxID=323732 RepID=A0AAD9PHW5_9APIC|nr:hypothetical protein BdWA1_003468 [Babesia duncani]